jgi:hypothetical protein
MLASFFLWTGTATIDLGFGFINRLALAGNGDMGLDGRGILVVD